jgi:pyruvate formate lyase activating enzyme
LEISGFTPTSFVDWDGQVVSTIFVPKCNFRCPFCFNRNLVFDKNRKRINEKEIFEFLVRNRDFIDGVCIIGGEPTLQKDLADFCRKIKNIGLKVKIDTNGSNPEMIEMLIKNKLVDFIAMDIKAPLRNDKYSKLIGIKANEVLKKVKKTVAILLNSKIDYEFRTTIVPTMISESDIKSIAKSIKNAKKYVLQRFLPEGVEDKRLKNERGQNDSEMENFVKIAKSYIKNVKWR